MDAARQELKNSGFFDFKRMSTVINGQRGAVARVCISQSPGHTLQQDPVVVRERPDSPTATGTPGSFVKCL